MLLFVFVVDFAIFVLNLLNLNVVIENRIYCRSEYVLKADKYGHAPSSGALPILSRELKN